MAAPKKDKADRRTKRVGIRFTEGELDDLKTFVNETPFTLSEFIRQAINEKRLLVGGFGFQSIRKL